MGARAIELPILYSFLNYSTKMYPIPTTWPGFGAGDAKINTTWPCLVQHLLYLFFKNLENCAGIRMSISQMGSWGWARSHQEIPKSGLATFFLQVQCSAHTHILARLRWAPKGVWMTQEQPLKCLRTPKLALDPVLMSQATPFLFFIQRFSTRYTQLWSQLGLNDTFQELLKRSLKKTILFNCVLKWSNGEKGWGLFEAALASLRTWATGVVKCSQKYCLAWKPLSMQMSHW